MRRAFPLCLLLCVFVLSRPAAAQSPCTPPSPQDGDVNVDLAVGAPTKSLTFRLRDQVRLVFTNRNPFLRYKVAVEGSEQEEPALAAFTKLFAIGSLATPPAAPPATPTPPAGASGAPTPSPSPPAAPGQPQSVCWMAVQKAGALLDRARGDLLNLDRYAGEINTKLTAINKAFTTNQETFDSPTATCTDIQAADLSLQTAVTGAMLDTSWNSYKAAYDDLFNPGGGSMTLTGQLDQALFDAAAKCAQGKPEERDMLSKVQERRYVLLNDANLQQISKTRTTLDATIQDVKNQAQQIHGVVTQPGSFFFIRSAGPFDRITNVKVSVTTKKAADKDFPKSPDFSFVMNFGGPPRFSLSVGIAASRLTTREYSAVQGLPLDTSGNPTSSTPVNVVGLKDDSGQRITPMLLINTRLWRPKHGLISGIHFSLGLSGKVDNVGTDVEYLGGFSFGFAENRALLTLGVYNGRVQKLQPGFYVGSPLGTVAQPSVRKDRHWKPMIAISYKIL